MSGEREPLSLHGVIHEVTVSAASGDRWEYLLQLSPSNDALLTSSDADQLAEYLRPNGGRTLTGGQFEAAVHATDVALLRADVTARDVVARVARAFGLQLPGGAL